MMDNESITMKIEVKDELFNEDFDVSEKVGIDLITSKEFDQNHILNVSNHTQKSSSMPVIIETFASTSSSASEIPKSKLPNKFTKDHVCHHKIGLIRKDPRFVCETYKTGETMNGLPYLAMSLTK